MITTITSILVIYSIMGLLIQIKSEKIEKKLEYLNWLLNIQRVQKLKN
jgi:hypothetical protein